MLLPSHDCPTYLTVEITKLDQVFDYNLFIVQTQIKIGAVIIFTVIVFKK